MKMFGKRLIAGCSAFAVIMSTTALGTLQTIVSAETNAPVPQITGEWQQDTQATADGSKYWLTYPRTADMTIKYDDSTYDGKRSITAVYDSENRLIGSGGGTISGGKAEYELNVSNSSGVTVKNYIWDSASLKPETAVYETDYDALTDDFTFKVPEVTKPEGNNYILRNSFENGTFNYFSTDGLDSKTKIEITDEVAANTGTKSVKVSNRTYEWHTLKTTMKAEEVGKTGKLHVEAYMKKPENVEKANFYIQVQVKTNDGVDYPSGAWINNVEDTSWHKVSADIDLSAYDNLPEKDGWYTALFNCSGPNNTCPDFYVDDVKIVYENSAKDAFFDDTTNGKFTWDFEDGNGMTSNRYLALMSDLNKWSATQANPDEHSAWFAQAISVADANEIAGNDTSKALKLESTSAWTTGHMTARVKVSKLDFVPGKEYELKFKAASHNEASSWRNDALYAGLAPHRDSAMNPSGFSGRDAGILKKADDDKYTNRVGAKTNETWQEFTYSFTPTAADFNNEGFADLCILITRDPVKDTWHTGGQITKGDALYLDDISIKPVDKTVPEITEYEGLWTKRATFENDSMDVFVGKSTELYSITDDFSHTGDYCLKVDNRSYAWDTLRVSLADIDPTSTLKVSTYIKNINNFYDISKTPKYYFELHVPKGNADDSNVWKSQGSVTNEGYDWVKVETEYDLSQYTGENADWSEAYVHLKTSPETISYYADDFIAVSNKAGTGATNTFIDDVKATERSDEMSDTAYSGTTYMVGDNIDEAVALYSKYSDKFKLGANIYNGAQNNSKFAKLFKKHFMGAVSNGYMKYPEILLAEDGKTPDIDGRYYKYADQMMKFCYDNGISDITGHALIFFGEDSSIYFEPDGTDSNIFFANGAENAREEATGWMASYISDVMKHFSGAGEDAEYTNGITKTEMQAIGIDVWDVVNEAVDDTNVVWCKTAGITRAFRKSGGYNNYDEVREAFKIANNVRAELREMGLAENMELRYNDYCSYSEEKTKRIAEMVKTLKDDDGNLIIDKIGVQSHYNYSTDFETVSKCLDILAATGIKVDITELEVKACKSDEYASDPFKNGITKSREYKQARLLKQLFGKYEDMAEKGQLDRVVFWAFADGYAYANSEPPAAHTDFAGLFDRKFAAKPQYDILTMTDEEFNAAYPDYEYYVNQ